MVFPLGLGGLSCAGGGWTRRKTVDRNPQLHKRTLQLVSELKEMGVGSGAWAVLTFLASVAVHVSLQ